KIEHFLVLQNFELFQCQAHPYGVYVMVDFSGHKHVVKIISNEELGIGMKDLVKDTLRMRPDRVVVGEVRTSEEAHALFDSLLAGQAKGSYFTFHANSSAEALQRLKAFGIAEDDLNAIDLVVVQKRISFLDKKTKKQGELRRVTEIAEVVDSKPKTLFEFDKTSASLVKTKSLRSSVAVEKVLLNYGFSESEFWSEVEKRKKFLESVSVRDFRDFTTQVQSFSFGGVGGKN
ncbi:MAG: ATPase, T2SS/T4P/T4SS family, partial [Candidatus Micrarchaeota archaeon]